MNKEMEKILLEMVEDLLGIKTINIYDVELFVENNTLNFQDVEVFLKKENIVFVD